jgi:hypothetical protein
MDEGRPGRALEGDDDGPPVADRSSIQPGLETRRSRVDGRDPCALRAAVVRGAAAGRRAVGRLGPRCARQAALPVSRRTDPKRVRPRRRQLLPLFGNREPTLMPSSPGSTAISCMASPQPGPIVPSGSDALAGGRDKPRLRCKPCRHSSVCLHIRPTERRLYLPSGRAEFLRNAR